MVNQFITIDTLASEFARRHEHQLRFVSKSKSALAQRWLVLNKDTDEWEKDDTLLVFALVREFCREAASACDDPAQAWAIGSAATISSVERLARCDRRLAATPEMVMSAQVAKVVSKKRGRTS